MYSFGALAKQQAHCSAKYSILINPGHDLQELKSTIETLAAASPNCAEFMSKYKKKDQTDTVSDIKVRWASEGRDMKLFPKETTLTEDNVEAVLRMMAIGSSRDVLDVTLEKKAKDEDAKA